MVKDRPNKLDGVAHIRLASMYRELMGRQGVRQGIDRVLSGGSPVPPAAGPSRAQRR